MSALGYVGFVLGPPLVGLLSAATSLPAALAMLAAVPVAMAVPAAVVLRRPPVPATR